MLCRPASDDDAPAIRDLRRAWTEEDAGGTVADDPDWERSFADWWEAERGHRRHWVVEVDGGVVAMASVVLMRRMPRPGVGTAPWGYVHHLYVLPEHRDAGLGRVLMDTVVASCRADGYQQVVLNPRPRSVPFYERLGFRSADHLLVLPL